MKKEEKKSNNPLDFIDDTGIDIPDLPEVSEILKEPKLPKPKSKSGRKAKSIASLSQQAVEELAGEDATNIFKGAVKQRLTPEQREKNSSEKAKEMNEFLDEQVKGLMNEARFKRLSNYLNEQNNIPPEPSLAEKIFDVLEAVKEEPELKKKLTDDPQLLLSLATGSNNALPFLLSNMQQGNNNNTNMFQNPFFMLMFSKFFNNQDDGRYVTKDHLNQFGNNIIGMFKEMLEGITKKNEQNLMMEFMQRMYQEKQTMTEQNFNNTLQVMEKLFSEKVNNIQQQLQESRNRPSELQIIKEQSENLKLLQNIFGTSNNPELAKMQLQHEINKDNQQLAFNMKQLENREEQQRIGTVMGIVDNLTAGVGGIIGSTIADKVMAPPPPEVKNRMELEGIGKINEMLHADQQNQLDSNQKKSKKYQFNV